MTVRAAIHKRVCKVDYCPEGVSVIFLIPVDFRRKEHDTDFVHDGCKHSDPVDDVDRVTLNGKPAVPFENGRYREFKRIAQIKFPGNRSKSGTKSMLTANARRSLFAAFVSAVILVSRMALIVAVMIDFSGYDPLESG